MSEVEQQKIHNVIHTEGKTHLFTIVTAGTSGVGLCLAGDCQSSTNFNFIKLAYPVGSILEIIQLSGRNETAARGMLELNYIDTKLGEALPFGKKIQTTVLDAVFIDSPKIIRVTGSDKLALYAFNCNVGDVIRIKAIINILRRGLD